MVSRRRQRLVLPVNLPAVETVLGEVSTALGWTLERDERHGFRVVEDAARLHCHCAPLQATVELNAIGPAETEVSIEGRVHGRGPVAGQHVREQTDLLARRIGLTAVRRT